MSRTWKFLLSFVIFATICYFGLIWFVNSEVEKGFNEAVANVDGLSVNYADLAVDILDQTVILEGVTATLPLGQQFSADTVRINAFDQMHSVPHFIAMDASGLTMNVSPANFGDWAAPLAALGRTSVAGDVAVAYKYNPDKQSLVVSNLDVSLDGLGEAKLTGTLDRLDLAQLRVEKLVGLRLAEMDLTVVNRSFMDQTVDGAATRMGISRSEVRSMFCAELDAMADYAGSHENSVAENALRGLKRFVDDPGTVTISAKPAEPVPFLYIFMGRDFYENLRLMNVTVVTDSSDNI